VGRAMSTRKWSLMVSKKRAGGRPGDVSQAALRRRALRNKATREELGVLPRRGVFATSVDASSAERGSRVVLPLALMRVHPKQGPNFSESTSGLSSLWAFFWAL